MLVICYGMAKSGSTLAYELVKGVLESAGHSQEKVKSAGIKKRGRGNHIASLEREDIEDTLAQIGPDRIVAAKTHKCFPDSMFPWMEEMQAARKIQVVASYRDPRDICLSLVDHGARSRGKDQRSYAHIDSVSDAALLVSKAIPKFRQWGALEGTLRLYYEMVAFSPDEAIDAIERTLGVTADHEAAKKHAFQDSFTQLNKARKNRFEDEMSPDDKAEVSETFKIFIEKVCQRNDQQWFTRRREQVLAQLAAGG